MPETQRCCATCQYWRAVEDTTLHLCNWPAPMMPFWAALGDSDHDKYTSAEQGQNCRTWVTGVGP